MTEQKYLHELRSRSLYCLILWAIFFLFFFRYRDSLFLFIVNMVPCLGERARVISTSIIDPFSVTLEVTALISFIATSPFILLQLLLFISPGLYPHEKRRMVHYVSGSFVSIVIGQIGCLKLVAPQTINLFLQFNLTVVDNFIELRTLVDFIIGLQIIFFLLSCWPWVFYFLIKYKIISRGYLESKRKHLYVISFVIGMLVTPPDVFSQCIVAIPLIIIFELVLKIYDFLESKHTSNLASAESLKSSANK